MIGRVHFGQIGAVQEIFQASVMCVMKLMIRGQ